MIEYVYDVQGLAKSHGDMNKYRLARRLGVSDSRAGKLWDGVTGMRDKTITLICNAYGCTPNDFIKPVTRGAKGVRSKSQK